MGISRRDLLRGRGSRGPAAPQPQAPQSRADIRRAALAKLGRFIAHVSYDDCLGSAGQVCMTCVERCPEVGAIRLEGTLPIVDAELCTGCGECEQRCPSPTLAIRIAREEVVREEA